MPYHLPDVRATQYTIRADATRMRNNYTQTVINSGYMRGRKMLSYCPVIKALQQGMKLKLYLK